MHCNLQDIGSEGNFFTIGASKPLFKKCAVFSANALLVFFSNDTLDQSRIVDLKNAVFGLPQHCESINFKGEEHFQTLGHCRA